MNGRKVVFSSTSPGKFLFLAMKSHCFQCCLFTHSQCWILFRWKSLSDASKNNTEKTIARQPKRVFFCTDAAITQLVGASGRDGEKS
jgi:hypothetical protein